MLRTVEFRSKNIINLLVICYSDTDNSIASHNDLLWVILLHEWLLLIEFVHELVSVVALWPQPQFSCKFRSCSDVQWNQAGVQPESEGSCWAELDGRLKLQMLLCEGSPSLKVSRHVFSNMAAVKNRVILSTFILYPTWLSSLFQVHCTLVSFSPLHAFMPW
jgi:hypothetical protein